MNNSEIEINNKLINEFLHEKSNINDYHVNWNSLMKTIQKIHEIKIINYVIEYDVMLCFITTWKNNVPGDLNQTYFEDLSKKSLIEKNYNVIIQFINWYNKLNIRENKLKRLIYV